jgi:hypothetical protein
VKLSPVNLRPLLRIEASWNEKAIALVASGYSRLVDAGDDTARPHAERWLTWLAARGPGWGYHFPVQTRVFRYARDAPNVIATAFVAHAFHDAGWAADAQRACGFLVDRLYTGKYFRYLEQEDELVHNANALACAALARTGDPELRAVAAGALEPTLRAQRPEGDWPYAEGGGHDWVDNFHTAYVLESLAHCRDVSPQVGEALQRGAEYWERAMFDPDGRPRYYADDRYPLDAHSYASAVDAWLALGELERAENVAALLVADMLTPAGYIAFQRRRAWSSSVPLVRWTNAPSFRALAGVLARRAHAGLD